MTDDTARKSQTDKNARGADNPAQAHRDQPKAGPRLHEEPVDPKFATIEGKVHPEPEQTKHEDAPWVQENAQPKSPHVSTSLIAGLVVLAAAVALILIFAV